MDTKENIQSRTNVNDVISSSISIVLIFFLHPLLSLVLIAFVNITVKVKKVICYSICAAYSVLIVNREYLIRFNEQSGDDTSRYIPFIKEIGNLSFVDALTTETQVFSIEPFSRVYWWLFSNIGIDINLILFFQVLFWSICLMIFSIKVSERYPVVIFCIGICFFAYTVPYTFYHLYRQAWGLSFFVIYLSLWDKRKRLLFLSLAALSHLMFIPIAIVMETLKKGVRVVFSKYLLPLVMLSLIVFYFTYSAITSKLGVYSDEVSINYTPEKNIFYIFFFTAILLLYNGFNTRVVKLSEYRFNIYAVLIVLYLIGLHPYFADISNRYILSLSPLVLMSLTFTKNKAILTVFLTLAVAKLLIHLSDADGNIYQYTMKGIMDFYNVIDSFLFFTGRRL